MKNGILATLIAIGLTGCAGSNVRPSALSPSQGDGAPSSVWEEWKNPEPTISGRRFFIDTSPRGNVPTDDQSLALIRETSAALKKVAQEKGYEEAAGRRKANLHISLVYREISELEHLTGAEFPIFKERAERGEKFSSSSSTFVFDKKVEGSQFDQDSLNRKIYFLTVQADSQTYGKRPLYIAMVNAYSSHPFYKHSAATLAEVGKRLQNLIPQAPEKNTPMAGDPGCLLRFGFLDKRVPQDGKFVYFVTKVSPNSAASRAKMKVGDEIEAIDSHPYSWEKSTQSKFEAEAYSGAKVPMRLRRGKDTIRTDITPSILCE